MRIRYVKKCEIIAERFAKVFKANHYESNVILLLKFIANLNAQILTFAQNMQILDCGFLLVVARRVCLKALIDFANTFIFAIIFKQTCDLP